MKWVIDSKNQKKKERASSSETRRRMDNILLSTNLSLSFINAPHISLHLHFKVPNDHRGRPSVDGRSRNNPLEHGTSLGKALAVDFKSFANVHKDDENLLSMFFRIYRWSIRC